jgi:hypothetical protein
MPRAACGRTRQEDAAGCADICRASRQERAPNGEGRSRSQDLAKNYTLQEGDLDHVPPTSRAVSSTRTRVVTAMMPWITTTGSGKCRSGGAVVLLVSDGPGSP